MDDIKKENFTEPILETLDQMRTTGFRPTLVICCVCNKKVLLLFKKDYRLWMLPQAGISSKENPKDVLMAKLKEEMGETFSKNIKSETKYLGEDQVEFLPEKQTGEELTTLDGKVYKMIGKHYYFYAVFAKEEDIAIDKTEYDEYYWLNYKGGYSLASKIYQSGKRRVTMKAIELLKQKDLIE